MFAVMMVACSDKETIDTARNEDTDTAVVEQTEQEGDSETNTSDTEAETDTDDAGTEDTSDTSDTAEVDTYGCQVEEWGVCLEGFVSEGWFYDTATALCEEFGAQNNLTTSLTNGCGVTAENVVGACVMTDMFEDFTVTGWYFETSWTESEASADCSERGGLFVT